MATQVEKAISWALKQKGSSAYAHMCQKFVATAYQQAGMGYMSIGSAWNAFNAWAVYRGTSYADIPIGAAVYFKCSTHNNGHVGLYIGNGQMVHTFPDVVVTTVAYVANSRTYTYAGWGWHGGVKPTGAGAVSAASIASLSSASSEAYAGSEEEEVKIIHIPQVEKLYTIYAADSPYKPVDRYQIVWKSQYSDKLAAKDITDKCGSVTLTDDSSAVCTELQFSVLGSYLDKYMKPLNIMPGDLISVTNTASNECIFVGQVQRTSGSFRDSMTIECADQGRLLTCNQVIMQFNNIAAKTAISHLANRVGIPQISCPNLVSSVYGIEKTDAASILQDILSTVTAENGVTYFPRVMGNTLVIKSFAKDCIVPYCRQESNVSAFPVLNEVEDPAVSFDIDGLKNRIIVYSEADSTVTQRATAKNDASIKRYGERVGIETFSDEDTVSASAKAKNTLARLNRWNEEVSLTTYGSDKVVAGVRLALELPEIKGQFHVVAVTHNLGYPHRMSMTLRRAD